MIMTHITRGPLIAVLTIFVCLSGCHRGYYRRQADNEARQLVAEKNRDPRWSYADGSIDIDPQSRMFDPFSKDHPPIPPDDPSSHQLMHCVDEKEGYPHWHANGDTNFVENPQWKSYLPVNEKGQVVLTMENAFQLALLHSPEYQQQRETLYLSALDVSLERFGFDTQLFAGFNSFLTHQGRLRNGGFVFDPVANDFVFQSAGSSSTLATSSGSNGQGITLEKLGITGTNFVVGLANSIIWEFSGDGTPQAGSSLIDFSIIQPLLRGAGRDRILESLTQTERTLLANVRQLERYRRGFYLNIIIGRNPGQGPSRGGNFLGLPAAANVGAGGFLGLLQQQQEIRISEFNVRQLENILEQFREFFARDRIEAVQVLDFETQFYSAQNGLLSLKTAYQNQLDQFKRQLGLPPDLEVIIEDPFLDKFKFVSDQVNERQIRLNQLRNETGNAAVLAGSILPKEISELDDPNFQWPDITDQRVRSLTSFLDNAIEMLETSLNEDVAEVREDIDYLKEARPRRLRYLAELRAAAAEVELLEEIEPELFDAESVVAGDLLERNLDKTVEDLNVVQQQLVNIRQQIETFPEVRQTLTNEEIYLRISDILREIPEIMLYFSNGLVELSLVQTQARSDAVEIANVMLADDEAFEIARCFRRDLMNARASLVDQWRRIEFIADQLESQVDLVFEGDIGNFGDNPFKVRYETGQLRAGFRFDAPVVRLAERNQYREILILYQQAKRDYYQIRDEISRNLRQNLRQLNLNKVLFEINRKTVQASIRQIEAAQLALTAPVRPGQQAQLGPTTAQNLSNAINRLQISQNAFLRGWVQYEVGRHNLDFDLGTMQLDEMGAWIDPGEIDESIGLRAAEMQGVDLSCQFCTGVPLGEAAFGELPSDTTMPSTDQNSTQEPTQESDYGPLEFENEAVPEMELTPPGAALKSVLPTDAQLQAVRQRIAARRAAARASAEVLAQSVLASKTESSSDITAGSPLSPLPTLGTAQPQADRLLSNVQARTHGEQSLFYAGFVMNPALVMSLGPSAQHDRWTDAKPASNATTAATNLNQQPSKVRSVFELLEDADGDVDSRVKHADDSRIRPASDIQAGYEGPLDQLK